LPVGLTSFDPPYAFSHAIALARNETFAADQRRALGAAVPCPASLGRPMDKVDFAAISAVGRAWLLRS
jgi:hypothetical protein